MKKPTIEELWAALRTTPQGAQRRIDSSHPLDLYADFEHPDRPGLLVICPVRPPDAAPLRSIAIERRHRQDGLWSLRILLEEPKLLPVFAELCRDIIEHTRAEADPSRAAAAVLVRIDRWHHLMQGQAATLTITQLRGLIGELLILERRVLPEFGPDESIAAWTGPLGTPHDFQLPTGAKLECKVIDIGSDQVRINGLGQLDGGGDPLQLAVVQVQTTALGAPDALTASRQVAQLRILLTDAPAALQAFELLLRFVGWDDTADTDAVVVRLSRIDLHDVDDTFPRLTIASVPSGVVDASYIIVLPPATP